MLNSALGALDGQINTAGMTSPVRGVNTLNWERREVVDFPDGAPRQVSVPSAGYAVWDAAANPEPVEVPVSVTEHAGSIEIANGLLRLRLNADGLLESVWDMEAGREVLAPGMQGNLFQLHEDLPNAWDAWDVDAFYQERVCELRGGLERLEVAERHALRAKIRIERRFGASRIAQDLILQAGSRRIDFVTTVDWHEEHKFLKVAFPVDVRSLRATYEIQFGNVERPTHSNTSWDMARFEAPTSGLT